MEVKRSTAYISLKKGVKQILREKLDRSTRLKAEGSCNIPKTELRLLSRKGRLSSFTNESATLLLPSEVVF